MRFLILSIICILSACSPQAAPEWPSVAEDRFSYWCVPSDGVWPVYLDEPSDCKTVSRGEWDHWPVTVNADDDLVLETLEAIYFFNREIGFELFRFETHNTLPDILVTDGGSHRAVAEAKRITRYGRHHGLVLAYNDLAADDRADVILHELGHLVGIRHRPGDRMDVLYPWDNGARLVYLDRVALEALRVLYLR